MDETALAILQVDLAARHGRHRLPLARRAVADGASRGDVSRPQDELAAGRPDVARRLAQAMETLAGESGLLPEPVWDSADIPDRGLFIGHASGSAMPLV
jgi:glucoamylase